MSSLVQCTLRELSELVGRGQASCAEVVQACLDRIDQTDGELHAFLSLRAEPALDEARQADQERAQGSICSGSSAGGCSSASSSWAGFANKDLNQLNMIVHLVPTSPRRQEPP